MSAQELTRVRSGKSCGLAQTTDDAIRIKPGERAWSEIGEGECGCGWSLE